MHRGLPGRVAATDDEYMLVDAEIGLARSGSVVHARPEKPVFIGQVEPGIFDARCADGRPGCDFCPVLQVTDSFTGKKFSADTRPRQKHLGTKAARLLSRPFGQFCSADATREPEIVFNSG